MILTCLAASTAKRLRNRLSRREYDRIFGRLGRAGKTAGEGSGLISSPPSAHPRTPREVHALALLPSLSDPIPFANSSAMPREGLIALFAART